MPNGSQATVDAGSRCDYYSLNFTSNNNTYSSLGWCDRDYQEYLIYGHDSIVNYSWVWANDAYKTIEITGGTDATNSELITWLGSNATQIFDGPTPTAFNTISYDSSTKVLYINGTPYSLDSSASGTTVTGNSFSQISLTSSGTLTIDGTEISLPIYTPPSA